MKNIYNFILFQALWLYTVLGVAKNNLWPAIIIFSGFAILFLFSDYSHKTDKKLLCFVFSPELLLIPFWRKADWLSISKI